MRKIALILAGGVGKRLGEFSTPDNPKYLLEVKGTNKSMLKLTYDRLVKNGMFKKEDVFVITNESLKRRVEKELPKLKSENILAELEPKNTFKAILFASSQIQNLLSENSKHLPNSADNSTDFIITVFPADQLVSPESSFKRAVFEAEQFAEDKKLAVIGVETDQLNPELGYILKNETETKFIEKPTVDRLIHFQKEGNNILKNSGVYSFCYSELLVWVKSIYKTLNESELESISFDKAIAEKLSNELASVSGQFEFFDLGTVDNYLNAQQLAQSLAENSGSETLELDKRNLIDKFKGKTVEEIKQELETTRSKLHIAIENWEHDFNIGSIVRTANAFNVATVNIIGKKRWNSRGAMKTDSYLNLNYFSTVTEFVEWANSNNLLIVGIDILDGVSKPIETNGFEESSVFLFGSENSGLSDEALLAAKESGGIFHISQFGSTRSLNASHAASIAIYEHSRRFNF